MGRRLNIMYRQYRLHILHGCMYMNYQLNIMVDGDTNRVLHYRKPSCISGPFWARNRSSVSPQRSNLGVFVLTRTAPQQYIYIYIYILCIYMYI